ncbi:uncharacterized protein SCHCODRAFT_02516030 [Schizophyllum commune H4-8]|nr:uncharacterized protein SCHCODRAFT_02516030 [Schizophyllum commune H4-8]KAI5887177.1 hypothetical protein SCHCODRAFT_02516030 [Schizophyllum commune H4-8]
MADPTCFNHIEILSSAHTNHDDCTPIDLRPIPAVQGNRNRERDREANLARPVRRFSPAGSESDIEDNGGAPYRIKAAPIRQWKPYERVNPGRICVSTQNAPSRTTHVGAYREAIVVPHEASAGNSTEAATASRTVIAEPRERSAMAPRLAIPTQLGVEGGLLARPDGQAGRPNRGGFTLKSALNWAESDYKYVKDWVHREVDTNLSCLLKFGAQEEAMRAIREKVRHDAKLAFLEQYADHWPVVELARARHTYNKRTIMKQMGRAALNREREGQL